MDNNFDTYSIILKKLIAAIPEVKFVALIDLNGNLISAAGSKKTIDKIESITVFSAILNFSIQKVIKLMLLGEIDTISFKGTQGYFIIFKCNHKRFLIAKTEENVRYGLIHLDLRRTSEKINQIPYNAPSNVESLEEKLEKIDEEFRNYNKIFFDYEITESDHQKLISIINEYKGNALEIDTRKIFRRQFGYDLSDSGKNWAINKPEIKILVKEKCQKNMTTQSIEIDIFGKKETNNRTTYILGECKNRTNSISEKEIKCFIIKASIIAQDLLEFHRKSFQNLPDFHLVIVSLKGFSEKQKIKKILKKYWKNPIKRILNEKIELIDENKFIRMLKENNISTKLYKK
ncbi:MAG: hypothetical protein P8Y97_03020 [Candidatus Lokiarchaeota archaeon]